MAILGNRDLSFVSTRFVRKVNTRPSVAIVYLGRVQASGEQARVRTWKDILVTCGVGVHVIRLLPAHRNNLSGLTKKVPALVRGEVVAESFAWSTMSLRDELRAIRPTTVICVTARSFDPRIASESWRTVLDFVDCLSQNYSLRAHIASGAKSVMYAQLSKQMSRFEQRKHADLRGTVAAGWQDAENLAAKWVPTTIAGTLSPNALLGHRAKEIDLLFVGNLSYLPNVAAVQRLARMWPSLRKKRPTISALIAGAHPAEEVNRLCKLHGWSLCANFANLDPICARTTMAVVPLQHATGIQNKVLDAAANGLAQVVDPTALSGFQPGFPAEVAIDDGAFVDRIISLLEDDAARADLARRAFDHVRQIYVPEHWTETVRTLISDGRGERK